MSDSDRTVVPGLVRLCLAALVWIAAAPPALAGIVTVLPVRVCDNAGINCANPAGNLFVAETNKIWAQAGISFHFLPFTSVNSSAFLNLSSWPGGAAALFTAAPGASLNPLTITMWFINDYLFTSASTTYIVYGAAEVGGNKALISQRTFTDNRIDVIAHELGHNLGLQHDDPGMDNTYLMRAGDVRTVPSSIGHITPDGARLSKLTAAQILTAQGDAKVVIPLPGALVLFASGLGLIVLRLRRGAIAT